MQVDAIYNEDCVAGMRKLPANSVDLCVTSPPYKDEDGYSSVFMSTCASGVFRVLKRDSLCFVNFGHLAEHKARPFEVVRLFEVRGFILQETFIWVKNHYRPIQGKKRVNNLTEFVFMFSKGKMPDLDRLSIGIPYADKSNVKRFAGGRDLKCAGNVWNIDYETIQSKAQKLHNDRFPVELPTRCIKLANLKAGSVVLDPFAGSFTTCLAAKKLGMNYLGYEISVDNYKVGTERLNEHL